MGFTMNNDPRNLFAAVKKATGKKLNIDKFNDRLMIQKGCYILNRWGYGPIYKYGLYIRGPYSSDLAHDYYDLGGFVGEYTDVPESVISDLSEIIGKGVRYAEAYSTILLVRENNPTKSPEYVLKKTLDIKPHLDAEVREAFASAMM
jgi:hypothetical protein